MMGRHATKRELFVSVSLDEYVPEDHLLRAVDRYLDLSEFRANLADSYSHTGRPSIDPELMARMLIVGYCYGIRSERRLCEEVSMNLAYRWFCRLGLKDKVQDHSSFSKNRHGRFRDHDAFRKLFDSVLRRCMAEGLVQGEGFATDASMIKADAQRQRSCPGNAGIDWGDPEQASRPVREYLAALEQANPVPPAPKRISLTDPASTWTAAAGPAIFAYSTNYLIDLKAGLIVDVEASAVNKMAEVEATKVMIDRVEEKFSIRPASVKADCRVPRRLVADPIVRLQGLPAVIHSHFLPEHSMTPTAPIRLATALSATLLAGCAGLGTGPGPDDVAFVVVGENGAATARLITAATACPPLLVDGRAMPMRVRVPHAPIPARPGQPHTPPSTAVLACEAPIAAGAVSASVRGRALPVPKGEPQRIVVIGDTGCRLKGREIQDCNDPQAFPFAQVAAAAAAFKPDLVVHVGDYHYREDPCPAGRAGCAGSPYGYGYDAWAADFFTPAAKLFAAAPWVLTRGNHENCSRAGQGWWRWLDPRPFQAGRDCDNPANDAIGEHSDPYAVPLGGGAQLIVFDTANTNWKGLPKTDPRRAVYTDTYRKIELLARDAKYNIAVDHHPMFAFGANRNAQTGEVTLFGGDQGLLDAFGDADPGYLPRSIHMLLSGHVHLWEQVSFASAHPTQFVAGFSGSAEDTAPLPLMPPPGRTPAPGAIVEHMSSWIDGFGFMTLERGAKDRPDEWRVKVWDREGRQRNSCSVKSSKSRCEVAQVK